MAFDNPLPWWALLGLVAGATLVTYRTYARPSAPLSAPRRASLAGLRLLTFLVLIAILLRPVVFEPAPERRDAVVPVLIDVSRSMRLADVDGRRRIDRAIELVRDELAPTLGEAFDVETLAFGEGLTPTGLAGVSADSWRSDLTGALEGVRDRYRGRSVAGIVVVSDGGDTSNREAAAELGDGPPVYPIGVGARAIQRDREVLGVTVGAAALPESVVELSASVVSHGFGDAPIEVRLLENSRVLQVSRVTATDGVPARELFQVSPKADVATLYTVEVPADLSELTAGNNTRRVLVPPAGRARRVLLVEGAPGYEHSFLKRAWSRDQGLELDSVVRKGQNELGEDTFYIQGHTDRLAALAAGYPQNLQALFFYDAVVLGNMAAEFFSAEQLAMTADFVAERGGGLLIFGARAFAGRGLAGTPVEEVLPLALQGRLSRQLGAPAREPNTVTLTPEGARHQIMRLGDSIEATRARWEAAPPLASVMTLGEPNPGASVLALTTSVGGGVHPLVAVQPYGRGRAMLFTGEASWRWKMLLPSDDLTYETFWRQTARWLSTASPDPVTVVAVGGAMAGEDVTLDVTGRNARYEPVLDAAISVRVTDPDGAVHTLQPTLADGETGRYVGQFTPTALGVHRIEVDALRGGVSLGTADAWILVGGADLELADPRLNDEVLRRVAAASDGELHYADEFSDLPELLRSRAFDAPPPIRRDLWHNVWVFVLLALLPSLEWTLRRQWGLR